MNRRDSKGCCGFAAQEAAAVLVRQFPDPVIVPVAAGGFGQDGRGAGGWRLVGLAGTAGGKSGLSSSQEGETVKNGPKSSSQPPGSGSPACRTDRYP